LEIKRGGLPAARFIFRDGGLLETGFDAAEGCGRYGRRIQKFRGYRAVDFGVGVRTLNPRGNTYVSDIPTADRERVFEILRLAAAGDGQGGGREAALEVTHGRAPVGPAHDDEIFPATQVYSMAGRDRALKRDVDLGVGARAIHRLTDNRNRKRS